MENEKKTKAENSKEIDQEDLDKVSGAGLKEDLENPDGFTITIKRDPNYDPLNPHSDGKIEVRPRKPRNR